VFLFSCGGAKTGFEEFGEGWVSDGDESGCVGASAWNEGAEFSQEDV